MECLETSDASAQKKTGIVTNIKNNAKDIILLLFLSFFLPSWDVYSDACFTISLLASGDVYWAGCMLTPQVLNIIFTFSVWTRMETARDKKWTWCLVLLLCWPQWMAVRIIFKILAGNSNWILEKKKLERNLWPLEPFLESLPSALILTGLLVDDQNLSEERKLIGEKGSRQYIMFFLTFTSSLLTASFGVIKFFKTGPMRFLPTKGTLDGLLTCKTSSVFFSVLFLSISKGGLLALMLRSGPSVKAVFYANEYGYDLLGRQCNHITLIYHSRGFEEILLSRTANGCTYSHYNNDVLYTLRWNSINHNWNATKCIFAQPAETQDCQHVSNHLIPVCGDWTDNTKVFLDSLLWFLINFLPQMVMSLLSLLASSKSRCISILSLYPQMLLSPLYSLYAFGPYEPNKLGLSKSYTWINSGITTITVGLSFYTIRDIVADLPSSRSEHQILMLAPVVLLFTSMIITLAVLHLPFCNAEDIGVLHTCYPEQAWIRTMAGHVVVYQEAITRTEN